jgi:hypothetical protein
MCLHFRHDYRTTPKAVHAAGRTQFAVCAGQGTVKDESTLDSTTSVRSGDKPSLQSVVLLNL